MEERTVSISSKGQLVIPKTLRRKYQIKKGTKLLVKDSERGILLTVQRPMADDIMEMARELKGKWPKGVTAVDIIRRERGKHG